MTAAFAEDAGTLNGRHTPDARSQSRDVVLEFGSPRRAPPYALTDGRGGPAGLALPHRAGPQHHEGLLAAMDRRFSPLLGPQPPFLALQSQIATQS
jgi:hypothetical protein